MPNPAYPEQVQLHIAGHWRAAADGRGLDVVNPASEAVLGTVAYAGIPDLDEALAAAGEGFALWSAMAPYDRAAILRKGAGLLRERLDHIATLLTMEQGKPIGEARAEVASAVDIIEWCAESARRNYGTIVPARRDGISQAITKEPVGPVAAFTPWNFPVNLATRKVAPALAAGCSVVLKGAEETPACVAELVRALIDGGLPDGVLNLVYGNPAEISEYLIPHPIIKKISFTGSTNVGRHLAALAGQHLKRTTMELGGHAPVIIAADADIGQAARAMAGAKFRNAGQICVAPTRFLVAEKVYDEFVDRFADQARAVTVGDGLKEGTTMGPLANDRRVPAMEALVQDAIQHGADLVTGGKRIGNAGYFFEPTVLSNMPREARAMNEEPFGPMALMTPVADIDEALAEANRLNYGLAAYAFTRSAATSRRLASGIASGMVSVNHYGLGVAETPFGGINDSGHGTEGGPEALEAYLNTRFVTSLHE